MKKIIFVLVLFLLAGYSFAEDQISLDEASYSEEITFEKAVYPQEVNVRHALWRGILNAFTCWLEIPRELVVENGKYPFFGLVSGTLKGAFFTTSRAVLSVVDIGMFGFTGPSAYDPDFFPEYVWQSQWNPYATNNVEAILDEREDFVVKSASMGSVK